jgi:hypothetical protein
MKIRNGFVSNSSSSSFCLYGACIDSLAESIRELKGEDVEIPGWDEDGYIDSADFEEETGIEVWLSESGPCEYVGVSYLSMEPDETRKQFEERADKMVREWLGPDIELGPLCQSVYN